MNNINNSEDDENIIRPDDNFESHTFTELSTFDDEDNYFTKNKDDILSNLSLSDLDLSDEEREQLIIELSINNPELLIESLKDLISRYSENENNILYETIIKICISDNTPFITKIECSKCLPNGDTLYTIIKNLNKNDESISHTLLWDSLFYLHSLKYDVLNDMKQLISNEKLNIEYRYNLIRNITYTSYTKELILSFISSIKEENSDFYIYCLQLLQKYNECSEEYCIELYNNYFINENLPDHIKANFADFLISTKYQYCKEIANKILTSLSGDITSLYLNKQNVHIIDFNIKQFTSLLNDVVCKQSEKDTITLISEKCTTSNQHLSIHRIQLDNGLYDSFSLSSILYRLYWYIDNHNCKDDLLKILLDELDQEPNSCSSGHLLRLINVLQGYTQILTVDPKIELKDSFNNKLTVFIQNSEHIDKIMEAIESENEENIIKYVYPQIYEIRNILIEEYKDILPVEIIEEEIRKNTIQFTIKQQ